MFTLNAPAYLGHCCWGWNLSKCTALAGACGRMQWVVAVCNWKINFINCIFLFLYLASSISLSTYPPIYIPTYLLTYLPALPTYLSIGCYLLKGNTINKFKITLNRGDIKLLIIFNKVWRSNISCILCIPLWLHRRSQVFINEQPVCNIYHLYALWTIWISV